MKSHFFSAGKEGGFEYETAQEVAAILMEHPDWLPSYKETMYALAANFEAWHDYKGMKETLNMLVDVLVELAQLNKVSHLK